MGRLDRAALIRVMRSQNERYFLFLVANFS